MDSLDSLDWALIHGFRHRDREKPQGRHRPAILWAQDTRLMLGPRSTVQWAPDWGKSGKHLAEPICLPMRNLHSYQSYGAWNGRRLASISKLWEAFWQTMALLSLAATAGRPQRHLMLWRASGTACSGMRCTPRSSCRASIPTKELYAVAVQVSPAARRIWSKNPIERICMSPQE